jgi:methylenetetrahydrofolate--tRNA-(uracil-5-)-methyltransferase
VEGYVESIATGLIAGVNAARLVQGKDPLAPPPGTACGSLVHYLANAESEPFQPANMSFGLLSQPATELKSRIRDKKERHRIQVEQALASMDQWIEDFGI